MEIKSIKRNLEKFLNSESKSAKATKVILAVVAVAGVVVVASMAPGAFQIFGRYKRFQKYSKSNLRQAIYRLKKQKLIEVLKEKDDRLIIRLTHSGQAKVKELAIDDLEIAEPKSWDRKWRVVIFDIPDKYKKAREALREKLKGLDFYPLQKSVWVHPFPCEDEIIFVANVFEIERFMEILTVEKMLHRQQLEKYFKL